MKLFICGQKFFGRAVFDLAVSLGHEIVGVSAPNDGSDRLMIAAKNASVKYIIDGGTLRADIMPDGVDLIVAAHSYDFISGKTLKKTKLGGMGFHPSLLPLHRGRDAIKWALRMGDKVTGGSVYWLSKNVDGGAIAAQDYCFIHPEDTAESLWRGKIQPMGLRLISSVLTDLEGGIITRKEQDNNLATWEPSLDQEPIFRPDLPQIGCLEGYRFEGLRNPTPPKVSYGGNVW
jgi:methionyl-tRNA formyltransferase